MSGEAHLNLSANASGLPTGGGHAELHLSAGATLSGVGTLTAAGLVIGTPATGSGMATTGVAHAGPALGQVHQWLSTVDLGMLLDALTNKVAMPLYLLVTDPRGVGKTVTLLLWAYLLLLAFKIKRMRQR